MDFLIVKLIFGIVVLFRTSGTAQELGPRGIFIQVSSSTTWVLPKLDQWLRNICARNSNVSASNTFNDMVLQDVASYNSDGSYSMRYDVLDIIAPYLPGGPKQCFGNVFVGTIDIPWEGSGNAYNAGILNSWHRQKNIKYSQVVAKEFKSHYPNIGPLHWYITYESNLNYLYDNDIKAAYEEYIIALIKLLTAISPGSVMWSPAFWTRLSSVSSIEKSQLQGNLNSLFTNIRAQAPPGINWMNIQDSVGKSGPCTSILMTPSDAVAWYRFLQSTFAFRSMQLNEELFYYRQPNCQLAETNSTTQLQREKFYYDNQVRMGAAFEIRYWWGRDVNWK